jgi:hypothetical protein
MDNSVVIKCEVNPLWRSLPYLPPGARELCQYDDWYRKKKPHVRTWYWADELFNVFQNLTTTAVEDTEQFYRDLLQSQAVLPVKIITIESLGDQSRQNNS